MDVSILDIAYICNHTVCAPLKLVFQRTLLSSFTHVIPRIKIVLFFTTKHYPPVYMFHTDSVHASAKRLNLCPFHFLPIVSIRDFF